MSPTQATEIRREYEDVELSSYTTLGYKHGVNASTIRNVIQYLGAYRQ